MTLVRTGVCVLLTALLFTALGCSCGLPRVQPRPALDTAVEGAEARPSQSTPEPTPEPWIEIPASELAPFAEDDPRDGQAAAVREGLAAFEEGRWEDSLAALRGAGAADGPAPELVSWTRGRALAQLDQPWDALVAWHGIGSLSRFAAEARLAEARVYLDAGWVDDAINTLGGVSPPGGGHPLADGLAAARGEILRAEALRIGGDQASAEAAYEAYKRVWIANPRSGAGAEAETGMKALRSSVPKALLPSLADRVARAEAFASSHQNRRIIKLLKADKEALFAGADGAPAVACAGTFQLGRAFHKRRLYRDSVPLLDWAGEHCPDEETTVKALYLRAQGLSRSGGIREAVVAFAAIADRHPNHSYADDGLYHAGRLEAAEGNAATADLIFDRQIREFPDGDMAGDTLWGRAHNLLTAGEPAEAVPHLERLATMDPGGPLRASALQARYWLPIAKMRIDPAARDAGIQSLAALAEEQPLDYYGVLALWKLHALDAAVAFAVHRRVAERVRSVAVLSDEPEVHRPERAFMELPGAGRAVALLRAGLGDEAGAQITRALGDKPHQRWNRDTLLFASHILGEIGDPYRSHNLLRFAFRDAFPPLDDETLALFTHAYPPAFMEEIRSAATAHEFPVLLFQGLVREESAFSPTIVSWAGAIGLSQLMWPTAKMTARKLGIRGLRKSHLRSPERNLEIGAAYFQELHERWQGHLPLAIASYNAGPGAVKRWIDARGDQTLDEWVEAIPYDQTRDYVKRVLGSFQIYNMLYDGTRPYVPLRVGPVRAGLDAADPSFPQSG